MEMKYRLGQEKLLANNQLNKDILLHCIARLNTKVNQAYRKCRTIQAAYNNKIEAGLTKESATVQHDILDYKEWRAVFDTYNEKKKPLLHCIMKEFSLSLDNIKEMLMKADEDKIPTYKTVDVVIEMVKSGNYEIVNIEIEKGVCKKRNLINRKEFV